MSGPGKGTQGVPGLNGKRAGWGCLALILLAAGAALAQPVPLSREADLAKLRTVYEFGKFEEALGKALALISEERASEKPNQESLLELYKYAGASAFNLGKSREAEPHFLALLQIDPDYALDPFIYPPPVVKFLEQIKHDNSAVLDAIRQTRREQRQRATLEKEERQRKEQEEARRRVEQLTQLTTVRTVERRSFLLNFIPFGAGQFQQGRNTLGVLLASSEVALAVTSVVAYWQLEGMITKTEIKVDGRLGSEDTVTYVVRGIPPNRAAEATAWRVVKYSTGAAFYSLAVYGVIDAIYHHQDEVVTSTATEPVSAPAGSQKLSPPSPTTEPGPSSHQSEGARPPTISFFPVPGGGVGAAMSLTF